MESAKSNCATQEPIAPEAVIAWMVTQHNANGSLYLERVARQYMSALRTTPAKLELPADLAFRDVFTCNTPQELLSLWNVLKTAPNYAHVNMASSCFSAGMNCLLKYLQHISIPSTDIEDVSVPVDSQSAKSDDSRATNVFRKSSGALDTILRQLSLFASRVSPEIIEKFTPILSKRFSNGFRLNSSIELMRFRDLASQELHEEIALPDEDLKQSIAACGMLFDGKVYVISTMTKKHIHEFAEKYFADGGRAIFYSEFYAKNEGWLFKEGIVSESMLIDVFRIIFPDHSFTETYFGNTTATVPAVLEGEVLRVWGQDTLLTYSQLSDRLQYIPIERLKKILAQNRDFIWSSLETFSHVSRVTILPEEQQRIQKITMQECLEKGYASITDFPLHEIEERNYELSSTAIHKAVFRICLSSTFKMIGKIITRKGDSLNALTIMKNYCRTLEKCTLKDLLTHEKELTGEIHHWIPMEAANLVLVRIDKENYVADRFVRFNTTATDAALEQFMTGDYLPLKSFTTFGAFPDCGQPWNLFLLENYCRRFSRNFRFDTLSVNSRNAGAVIRSACDLNYIEIMSDAVVTAGIPLTTANVAKFLSTAGYTGRSTTKTVTDVLNGIKIAPKRNS